MSLDYKAPAYPAAGFVGVSLLRKSVLGGRGGRAGLSPLEFRPALGINGGGVDSFACSVAGSFVEPLMTLKREHFCVELREKVTCCTENGDNGAGKALVGRSRGAGGAARQFAMQTCSLP